MQNVLKPIPKTRHHLQREIISQRTAAGLLGVHPTYLNAVLNGRMQSRSLMQRYELLLEQARQTEIQP